MFDDHMWEKVSYALGVKLKDGSSYPSNMYITTDKPMRTIRTAQYQGDDILIFGGESHEYRDETFEEDMQKHYQALIADVQERFDVEKVLFRWLASDQMPYDHMPYIGPLPDYDKVLAVTGYRAWGLAWAMSAAEALVGDMTGSPVEWVKPFRLERLAEPIAEEDKIRGV